jgi:hypothetical protein
VAKEQEDLLDFALPMAEAAAVKKRAAIKELRGEQFTARPTVVVVDANILGVLKVLKDVQISVLPTVAGGGAVMKHVGVLLEVNLGCAFGMVVARDAKKTTAQRVQKGCLAFAYHMEVAGDANIRIAPKGLKVAQCSARRMVAAKGVHMMGAIRVQKGVRLFARVMVEGKGVHSKVVVRRVCMVGPNSVLHMVVVRGVLCRIARRVHVGGPTFVSVTVVERGASLKGVERVHREALIFARLMVEVRDAHGANVSQSLVKVKDRVIYLLGERLGYVQHMVLWFRTNGFMGVPHLDPWSRILNLACLRR